MSLKAKIIVLFALVLVSFGTVEQAAAVIDSVNVTSDINTALDIFWLVPESVVDHFGTLIVLIMFGAIIGLIGVIIYFLRKVLTGSTKRIGGDGN